MFKNHKKKYFYFVWSYVLGSSIASQIIKTPFFILVFMCLPVIINGPQSAHPLQNILEAGGSVTTMLILCETDNENAAQSISDQYNCDAKVN